MITDFLVTENRALPVVREIGFVSTAASSERAEAISVLKGKSQRLGGNALILLRIGNTVSDPHFPTGEVFAHGVAVKISREVLDSEMRSEQ